MPASAERLPPPLSAEQTELLARLSDGLDAPRLWWLSGYAAGLAGRLATSPLAISAEPVPAAVASPALSIVYGSQTGNAKRLAETLAAQCEAAGLGVRLPRADAYPLRELKHERCLYLFISTQGDGDPPDDARELVDFLSGKRAPTLKQLRYAASEYALDVYRNASPVRLNVLACVALPTCGLAMAEAERYLPHFLDLFETLLDSHGLRDANLHLRISGCPNGCSRPYLGEVVLVGKAPGHYNLMFGADRYGERLNVLYRENIDEAAILAALEPLLARYAIGRAAAEGFGDFLLRAGFVQLRRAIALELQP